MGVGVQWLASLEGDAQRLAETRKCRKCNAYGVPAKRRHHTMVPVDIGKAQWPIGIDL